MVFFVGRHKGLGPFGVVYGVGIELGLQSHTGALTVVYALLAFFVQVIACVELDAGAVGGDSHGSAGDGILQNSAGIAKYLKIMVVASLKDQGLVIHVDILSDGLGLPEVEGGAFHGTQFSRGDVFRIVGGEEPAGDGQKLIHGLLGMLVASQIEIAVVGHIEYGILITDAVIGDSQNTAGLQCVGHMDHRVAGEALIAVGAVHPEADGIFGVLFHLPQADIEAVGAGVEVICVIIDAQRNGFVIQNEAGVFDPVGIASHGCAQKRAAGEIAGCLVKAQHHVRKLTLPVRNEQLDQRGTAVGDAGG